MSSKSIEHSTEVGGYFGLTLPDHGDSFPTMHKYQSARAALRAALEFAGIKRIILPTYICACVPKSLSGSGVVVDTYDLDNLLYPKLLPEVNQDGSAILYVNYFGLCKANVDRLLDKIPKNKLIIDNSQALFAQPTAALASIYSVRKFLGVPDGGLLATHGMDIKVPVNEDTESMSRMKHLLIRMAYSAREGYSAYLESEKSLDNATPLRMSRLTSRLLASIDMEHVREQRRENFMVLAAELEMYNTFKWTLDAESVPMCYPLVLDRDVDSLRRDLAVKDIFIPTYWPDACTTSPKNSIEHRLKHNCLAVPCDQRYSRETITRIASTLLTSLKTKST